VPSTSSGRKSYLQQPSDLCESFSPTLGNATSGVNI
jgi:hypothetical protein